MGNDYGTNYWDYDGSFRSMRRGWAPVSEAAKNQLENAKEKVRDFIIKVSFDNIEEYHINCIPTKEEKKEYKITNKKLELIKKCEIGCEVINFHIVSKLRPKLNQYCKNFGCSMKWRALSDSEKKQTKYKSQVRTVYYGTLYFNCNSKMDLINFDKSVNDPVDVLAETCLFSKLKILGIPQCDALGWISKNVPKTNPNEKLPYVKDIGKYIDSQKTNAKFEKIFIETRSEYSKTYPYILAKINNKINNKNNVLKEIKSDNNNNNSNSVISNTSTNHSGVSQSSRTKTTTIGATRHNAGQFVSVNNNYNNNSNNNSNSNSLFIGNIGAYPGALPPASSQQKQMRNDWSILGIRRRSETQDNDINGMNKDENEPPRNKRRIR